ncbi:P-loop containing nucleoside triphosphate hydrolase protein [Vararia minispora EC-137]|uniref:P-loop containing nucleoside triphosphate hydrolase protein n=1 Tax=Vararia minispora EC-137 TaxID=1314806 RepID=A0ACB8QRN3_9AGAM|nr:P-loop containing nucleoside triphosphate hydrolase protein [Vararia minispora EC-137]
MITQNTISSTSWNNSRNQLQAISGRYQNRLAANNPDLQVTVQTSTGSYTTPAMVSKVAGPSASIKIEDNLSGKIISSIQSVGKSGPTQAEIARQATVLGVLQGLIPLWDNPWLQSIWLTSEECLVPTISHISPNYPLNLSQTKAVNHMLSISSHDRISLIQGPPGTGKTSVIAAYVLNSIQAGRKGIWLVAQSNVAVKNIAEKLVKVGFTNWKLIVSADFHFGWHEHLYHEIARNIIRSDQFPKGNALFEKLKGCQVMLCTLSMLSNKRAQILGFFRAVPLINLVIDEASQIEVGNYVSVFSNHNTIQKVCFIGDDKQLPPHGSEEIQVLESIFEMDHLHSSALFLDTQYRMPPQIGDFISKRVYNGQLFSNPEHPITSTINSIHLVDITDGSETASNTSYIVSIIS